MKNIQRFVLFIALAITTGFGLSACKDDDPPSKPKLSFAETEMTVNEAVGNVRVEVILDKAHSKDLRIDYMLGGTADDRDVVGAANADYQVVGDPLTVVIEAGQTSGFIELEILSDAAFEEDETIEIEIFDANTEEVEITAENKTTITITNDDEQRVANFKDTTPLNVNEDNAVGFYFTPPVVQNLILIPVQLDIPASSDIIIEYTLEGSAFDSTFAATYQPNAIPPDYYDYYINGKSGELVIPAGQTEANIEIGIYADFVFEDDETIEITLTGSNGAEIGSANKIIINLAQQDGKAIALVWNKPEYTDVDMDLILWLWDENDATFEPLAFSAFPNVTQKSEVIFIPALISAGTFGLSHNYYSGSADPLEFNVHFVDFIDGILEDEADEDVFTATYSSKNINPYGSTNVSPVVVQTFEIEEGEFVDISDITVPESGSRLRNLKLPKKLGKSTWRPSTRSY